MMHPIILAAYNRPQHLALTLYALREQRAEPLFIFSDGPKNSADAGKVEEVRTLIKSYVDWTTPYVTCRAENLGLGRSIVRAVGAVLSSFDTMILLEDDCVPSSGFFDFMYRCLDKYAQQDSVMSIGGWTMAIPDVILKQYDYDAYFVTRIESWGWATWRRAWQHYEPDYADAYARIQEQCIDYDRDGHSTVRNTEQAIRGYSSGVVPWSPGWMMAAFLQDGYCVYPTRSLIENIGFDGSGASCSPSTYYDVGTVGGWRAARFPSCPFVDPTIHAVVKEFYR